MRVEKVKPNVIIYGLYPNKDDEEYHMCMWARFSFDCDNGRLNINSDAGDYSYGWGHNEHEEFMHLMSRVNKEYLLDKISGRSEFNIEKSKKETIKNVKEYGITCMGVKNGKRISEIVQDIKEIDNGSSEETFFREVDAKVPEIEWESISIIKEYPHGAVVITELFDKYIKPVIKEELMLKGKEKDEE